MITRRDFMKGLGLVGASILFNKRIAKCEDLENILSDKTYYMPNYWNHTRAGQIILFKDIAGNELLNNNHDSMEYILNHGVMCESEDSKWYGYRWEFVYRNPDNHIYKRIPTISLLGHQKIDGVDYIVDKKDTFEFDEYTWSPYKKVSKVHWSLNDPIKEFLVEYNTPDDYDVCSDGSPNDPVSLEGGNIWVIKEALSELKNEFFDGTSRTWRGKILHVQEYEHYNGNLIDYWFKSRKGLIRLKITTELGNGYNWLEVGAQ